MGLRVPLVPWAQGFEFRDSRFRDYMGIVGLVVTISSAVVVAGVAMFLPLSCVRTARFLKLERLQGNSNDLAKLKLCHSA